MILSGAWSEFISLPLPTALVALGLENVNTDITDELLGPSPQPGMGLYLTGTLDNLAKANTNVEQWLDDQSIPWHYMSVVGANHVQYQDESGWWDGFNDGTATMNRSYQHEHALNHILPYLDLMLKGEHEQWLQATNRESNWQAPSDSDAYIYEDLSSARFMPIEANTSDVNEFEGNMGRLVSLTTKLTHRNGELPLVPQYVVQSKRVVIGGILRIMPQINSTGVFTSSVENGTHSSTYCEVPTEGGSRRGIARFKVDVDWYGMPSYMSIDFYRENRIPREPPLCLQF